MNILLNCGSTLVDVMETSRRHDLATCGAPETILIDRCVKLAQQHRTTILLYASLVNTTKSFDTKVQSKISAMGRANGNAENKLRGYKAYVLSRPTPQIRIANRVLPALSPTPESRNRPSPTQEKNSTGTRVPRVMMIDLRATSSVV
jgi:hypothetical protein